MLPSTSREIRGICVGIDLGGSKIRAAAADTAGTIIAESTEPTDHNGGRSVLDQIGRIVEQLQKTAGQALGCVAIGSPGVMDSQGRFQLSFNIDQLSDLHLADELRFRLGAAVVVENDVNMAALGELWQGLGRGHRDFAILSVGTGLGMGLVLNGRLYKGARGFAGEVAYLPLGGNPQDPASRRVGTLESVVGTYGILNRFHARGGSATDVADVFAQAGSGDLGAARVVRDSAELLAASILAICSVVDPELVIMTGGIGSDPMLIELMRAEFDRISPHPVAIERSQLGERAGVVGAVAAAVFGPTLTESAL